MEIDTLLWKFRYIKRAQLCLHCYKKKLVRIPYSPLEVFIEPTNHCNLKCIICPHGFGLKRKKGFMSLDMFKGILEKVARAKVLKVTLNFAGEPLLNKNIFDMIHLTKDRKLYIRIHTNGTILSEDYAKRIISSGLDELSFSFDHPKKEVYEKIRVNASYEKVLSNIRMFLEIKKRLKAKKPYTIIQQIKLGNFDDNNCCKPDYQKLFAGLPVDEFNIRLTHNWAGTCQDSYIEKYNNNFTRVPCMAIWARCAIGWDGNVYACCNEMNGKLFIGDIIKTSLSEIWNGSSMIWLRKMMLDGKYGEIEACKDCDVLVRSKKIRINAFQELIARILLATQKQ